jgi:hypothetical protein
MSEPIRTPSNPEASLKSAKDAFRLSFLGDDTAFAVVREKLEATERKTDQLPDWSIEPTLRRDESDVSQLGLRINGSSTDTAMSGIISLQVAIYDYLPIGTLDRVSGIVKPSSELEEMLQKAGFDLDKEPEGPDDNPVVAVFNAWQTGVQALVSTFPSDVHKLVLSPDGGTFELNDSYEVTSQDLE